MEREEFTVTYELDERMVNRLNRLTERWRAMGREITPEELFGFAMTMDGGHGHQELSGRRGAVFEKAGGVKHGE